VVTGWQMAATSISNQLADQFLQHAVDLARFEAHEQQRILRLLKKLERDLVKDLASADPTAPTRTAFQQGRLEALLEQTRRTINGAYRQIATSHQSEMRDLADFEAEQISNAVNGSVGASVMSVAVPETQLAAIASDVLIQGAPSRDWWKRQAGGVQQKFENAMRQGVLRGETNDDLVRRVRGTKAKGYSDGIVAGIAAKNAKALVRSSVQAVANKAREDLYEANDDVLRGVQVLSTLDGRTTPICIARSNAAWDPTTGKPLPESPRQEPYPGAPPYHFQCRSILLPVLKPLDDLLEGTGPRKSGQLGKLPAGQQASMDGQVAGDLKYED